MTVENDNDSDLASEELFPLGDAKKWFLGNPPAANTLRRYVSSGCRGVVLESMVLRGRRHTSKEAIRRFERAVSQSPLFAERKSSGAPN
ncbi:MAG: DUF1580 domain-containing protein [Candidatus Paceibacterota bacterium]